MKKERCEIPDDVAAAILFQSDRTCCVCRTRRKPIQLHHVDGNPANSEAANLAVLCLECHDDTLQRGGFGRKLDAAQVVHYRDDWHQRVADARAVLNLPGTPDTDMVQSTTEEVRDHDRTIFTKANAIADEEAIMDFLAQLYHDDSYVRKRRDEIIGYLRFLERTENEFLSDAVLSRARAMLDAFGALADFVAHHFFDWPPGQQSDNPWFCLYPEHNLDRGNIGDVEKAAFYEEHQERLSDLVVVAEKAWKDFRRSVKRALLI
jgi:hypothetical protein